MNFELTANELSDYQRDGYLLRQGVFDTEELAGIGKVVEHVCTAIETLSENGKTYVLDGKRFVDVDYLTIQYEGAPAQDVVRVIEPAHQLHPALSTIIDDPRIVEPMRKLVASDTLALWTDKLNLKCAKAGSGFGWHQDSPYWIHDSEHVDQLVNVYLALDDADESNGCFRIIKGSHTKGCLPGTDDGSQLGGFYTNPACFDESQQVAFEVAAGSLIFFNAHTVHGSQANLSDKARRAFIMTYQPADLPMLKSGRVRNII